MIDIATIIFFLILVLSISIYCKFYTHPQFADSLMNPKRTSSIIMATTLGTTLGGGGLIGLIEQTILVGIPALLIYLAHLGNSLLSAYLIVPILPQSSNGTISPGNTMAHFYGKWGLILASIATIGRFVTSIGVQIFIIGFLIQYFFDISIVHASIASCFIVVAGTFLYNIKTLTLADTILFIILLITFPILLNLGLHRLGGYEALFSAIPKSHFSLFPNTPIASEYIAILLLAIIPASDPLTFRYFFSAKNKTELKSVLRLNVFVGGVFYLVTALLAFIILALQPAINPSKAFPYLLDTLLPIGLKELSLVALIAMIILVSNSFFSISLKTLVQDVINPLWKEPLSEKTEKIITCLAIFLFSGIGLCLALRTSSVLSLIIASRFLWVSMITFPLLAALAGIHASIRSFILAAAAGSITATIWTFLIEPKIGFNGYFISFSVNAFVFSLSHIIENRRSIKFPFEIFRIFSERLLASLKQLKLKVLHQWMIRRVEPSSEQYTAFGIFTAITYIIPDINWSRSTLSFEPCTTEIRFIGGFLALFLIFRDRWPEPLKAYLKTYWYLTLLYTLSFSKAYMVMCSHVSWESLSNTLLGMFLLSILVDWISFLVILLSGVTLAIIAFSMFDNLFALSIQPDQIQWMIYMYSFSIAIGIIFSRHKENFNRNRLEAIKVQGAYIAHEASAPLVSIATIAQGLSLHLPSLIKTHEAAKKAGLPVEEIPDFQLETLKVLPTHIKSISQSSLTTVDILLTQIKGASQIIGSEFFTAVDCVENALLTYPFLAHEKELISWSPKIDFKVLARQEMLVHIMYNLIKNSLYEISKEKKGEISIRTERDEKENRIHFKDTDSGIEESEIPLIFQSSYTTKRKGNGLGLSFCKQMMESAGGKILCHSQKNRYAEFVLIFPILETSKNEIYPLL
ncbi:MAG: ATP-binding protein [Myxococcaceae bacterium]